MSIYNTITNTQYIPLPVFYYYPVPAYPVGYPVYDVQYHYVSDPAENLHLTSFNQDTIVVVDDELGVLVFPPDRGDEEHQEHVQEHEERIQEQHFEREERLQENLTTRIQQEDSDDDICVICQEEYKAQEKLAKMKCGHEFHNECIREWLFRKYTCPMCKARFY